MRGSVTFASAITSVRTCGSFVQSSATRMISSQTLSKERRRRRLSVRHFMRITIRQKAPKIGSEAPGTLSGRRRSLFIRIVTKSVHLINVADLLANNQIEHVKLAVKSEESKETKPVNSRESTWIT